MPEEELKRRSRDRDYAAPLSDEEISGGRHRRRVGRKWDVMGPLQRQFLVAHGLQPSHRLLDVGCGALRAGIHLIDYLEPGNYHGIDINQTLLDAGYERELHDDLRAKLPRENLRATDRFDCDFRVPFDFAIAQSVFTHVSLNHVRLCLYRVAKVMPPGGRFYATFFQAPSSHPVDRPRGRGKVWTERNAFFYYLEDIEWAARWSPWEVRYIGEWDHPRHQRMMEFRRLETLPRRRVERTARRVGRRLRRLRS